MAKTTRKPIICYFSVDNFRKIKYVENPMKIYSYTF